MRTWQILMVIPALMAILALTGCGDTGGGRSVDETEPTGSADATSQQQEAAEPADTASDGAESANAAQQESTDDDSASEDAADADTPADDGQEGDAQKDDAEQQDASEDDAQEEDSAQETDEDADGPTELMEAFEDDGDVAELTIEGNDTMQFNKDRLTVEAGQMVRLTLEHVGQQPAQAMGHNVVVLEQGENAVAFGGAVGQEGGNLDNDYLPVEMRDRVIAFTDMIGGGETTTVEFKAPEEPGEYPFLCSFPGHFAQMNGVLEVQE